MTYIPVPCPLCDGLVKRDEIRCTRCKTGWASVLRMCGEGVSRTQEHIVRLAALGEWTKENVIRNLQETIELYTLAERYYRQMEIELR